MERFTSAISRRGSRAEGTDQQSLKWEPLLLTEQAEELLPAPSSMVLKLSIARDTPALQQVLQSEIQESPG